MGLWLHEHYRWLIPAFFGGLLAGYSVRYWFIQRQFDRDDDAIKRAIEQIERRLSQK